MINNKRFDKIYKRVPLRQKEELRHFRSTHSLKTIIVDGREWEYISTKAKSDTILFLIGGFRFAEAAFQHIRMLENSFNVIVPSYGPSPFMQETVDAIINYEDVKKVHVLGQSLGGLVAQCLIRCYPNKFVTMIISNTTAPVDDINRIYCKDRAKKIKKRVGIMRWLPYWLISRAFAKKFGISFSIVKQDAEFWKAYAKETFQYHTTKQELINTSLILVDVLENYNFSRSDLQNRSGRILLIGSDFDPAVHFTEWKAVTQLYPQATMYMFQGTGHLAILKKSHEYLSVVTDFIQKKSE